MTYCHVSAQIDRHLAEFDRAQAWQEAIEARANEIYASCESWEHALEVAARQLEKELAELKSAPRLSLQLERENLGFPAGFP